MDSVFSRFETYDFAADQRFQDGLRTLQGSVEGDKLRDMKLFFYNRFVEPIERTGYKQWASQASRMNQTEDEQQEQNSVSDCLPGGCDQQNSESCAEEETTTTTQLSFAEVMRLVQEGKEVPGVKQLDVKASNQSPTPSRMERVLKPWETS